MTTRAEHEKIVSNTPGWPGMGGNFPQLSCLMGKGFNLIMSVVCRAQDYDSPYFTESHIELREKFREWLHVRCRLSGIAEHHENTGERVPDDLMQDMGMRGIHAARLGPGPHLKQWRELVAKDPAATVFGVEVEDFDCEPAPCVCCYATPSTVSTDGRFGVYLSSGPPYRPSFHSMSAACLVQVSGLSLSTPR